MGRGGVEAVARRFCVGGDGDVRVQRHTNGHIHQTWLVSSRYGSFVLQRLNDRIFADCVQVMDNIARVTTHLHKRVTKNRLPEPERRVLWPLRADGGGLLVYDEEGGPWRAFRLVDRAISHDVVRSPADAYQIGRAFGCFFDDVQDVPGGYRLPEPIPGFKDFERRRLDFDLVVEADPFDRAGSCRAEREILRQHHRLVKAFVTARDCGRLRTRVVHNDAKANNVLLDAGSGEALCVIDLDTVGPGSVLFDVGDLLRSTAVPVAEDADPRTVTVRDDLLDAALRGYLREAALLLSPDELALLPLAGPLMAYENAIRFLTDHLVGDVYYRVDGPGHNLHRARTQLQVMEVLIQAEERVADLVGRYS